MIDPDFFTDDKITDLPPEGRLLFIGLWCQADDAGNLHYSPKQIKRRVLPDDLVQITDLIDQLVLLGLVDVYTADNQQYIHIVNFGKHQKINRPSPAICPAYPGKQGKTGAKLTDDSLSTHGVLTDDSLSTHGALTPSKEISKEVSKEIEDEEEEEIKGKILNFSMEECNALFVARGKTIDQAYHWYNRMELLHWTDGAGAKIKNRKRFCLTILDNWDDNDAKISSTIAANHAGRISGTPHKSIRTGGTELTGAERRKLAKQSATAKPAG